MERPEGFALLQQHIGLTCLFQGMVGIQVGPGTDLFIERCDAIETGAHQLFGCNLTGANCRYRFGGADQS
jgi:hypothetical protein